MSLFDSPRTNVWGTSVVNVGTGNNEREPVDQAGRAVEFGAGPRGAPGYERRGLHDSKIFEVMLAEVETT